MTWTAWLLALAAAVLVALMVLTPDGLDVLVVILVVAPFTATAATWYIRRVYLKDRRVDRQGNPLRSVYLRRAWRSSAIVTLATYPLAFLSARRLLGYEPLPIIVSTLAIATFVVVALIVPHWLALGIWQARRRSAAAASEDELDATEQDVAGHAR
jgi:hypothetical protein